MRRLRGDERTLQILENKTAMILQPTRRYVGVRGA
jgi:hypothetical protein